MQGYQRMAQEGAGTGMNFRQSLKKTSGKSESV